MSIAHKILVVDDDLFTAELTALTLETSGYEVVLADGGMDALEKVADDPLIKVIVSDMNMPLINGVELFEELRQQGFLNPFVLLTGDDVATLKNNHPDIDAVVAKDEQFQELLSSLMEKLMAK